MTLGLFFAIISPFLWGAMNVIDKYIIHKKVKHPMSYTPVVGIVTMLVGVVLGLFLEWQQVTILSILFPALAGFFLAFAAFFYILLLEDQDVSHIVGLIYVYPLLVALLSFIFLDEQLTVISYVGVFFILAGILLLTFRLKKIKRHNAFFAIIIVIIFTALNEFFAKLSTTALSAWQSVVINEITLGIALICGLFNEKIRKHFFSELKNLPWEAFSAAFAFGGITTLYAAMASLPVTVVSSIGAIQPLAVLIFERIIAARVGTITKDQRLLPKLSAILLIVIGVALLSLSTS